jgi:RimJ/RimL family protein N-acetyltransferase
VIEGKNIIIRQLELGDEEYIYKWLNDGKMMAHDTLCYGTLQSKEAVRLAILKDIENYSLFPESKRFLICKKEDMKPIGDIRYIDWNVRNQKCDFGIRIGDTSEQGKGYGKDILYHFIDFLFRFLNLNKIESTTMIDNIKAQGLYWSLGFKKVGVLRQSYFDARIGNFEDELSIDLLKSDWIEVKKNIEL